MKIISYNFQLYILGEDESKDINEKSKKNSK